MNGIFQPLQYYYNSLPDDTFYSIGRSAVFSFTVSLMLSGGNIRVILKSPQEFFQQPLLAAASATLASTIHALMTPFFNKIFGDDEQKYLHRETIKNIVTVAIVRLTLLGTWGKVDEIANPLLTLLSMNCILSGIHTLYDVLKIINSPGALMVQNQLLAWGFGAPNTASTYIAI